MKPNHRSPHESIIVMDGDKQCQNCAYRLASIIGGASNCPYLYDVDKCVYMKEWMRLIKETY